MWQATLCLVLAWMVLGGIYSVETKRKKVPSQRILGGEIISIHKAPWVAVYGGKCASVILNERWLLTAAHCGQMNYIFAKPTSRVHGNYKKIAEHHPHDKYNEKTLDYDYQMLKLLSPIDFDEMAKPVKLGYNCQIRPGGLMTVMGWGIENEDSIVPSMYLKSVEIPIKSKSYCQRMYWDADKGNIYNITKRMICGGSRLGGKDSCKGDSGGPALVDDFLIGMVSFGHGCGRLHSPGVYSKVTVVKKWIYRTMKKKIPRWEDWAYRETAACYKIKLKKRLRKKRKQNRKRKI